MPTYQTAPMYYPVFPTLVRNPFGVQPLKGNTLVHAEILPAGHDSHPSWKKQADFRALARVENTKISKLDMLKGPPSIKGNAPFTTFRGPQGHSLSGGVITTKEGQETLQRLLRDRKYQLDAIDQSSFEAVAPERLKESEPETDTFQLDQLFSQLYSSLDEDTLTDSLLKIMAGILNFFLTKSDKISEGKFTEYMSILADIQKLLTELYARPNVEYSDSEYNSRKRIFLKLDNDVRLLIRYIKDFSAFLGSPTKAKTAKLMAIRQQLLKSRGIYSDLPEMELPNVQNYDDMYGPDNLMGAFEPQTVPNPLNVRSALRRRKLRR
jgi:hypothetical protein